MKRILFISLFVLLSIVYFACKKDAHVDTSIIKDPFVTEALNFVGSKVSKSDFESIDVTTYTISKDSKGNPSLIRFFIKGESNTKFIIVGKNENGFEGSWVDESNLGAVGNNSLSGILATRGFDNNESSAVSFNDNKVVKIVKTKNGKTNTTLIRYENGKPIFTSLNQAVAKTEDKDFLHNTLPEVIVYPTPQTPVTYYSVFYLMNSSPSYLYSYTTNPYYAQGGGPGSNNTTVNLPMFLGPDQPINIQDELKCLTPSASGSTFTISINVNQPVPGTRIIVNPTSVHPVGHTYITLSQTKSTGEVISRNVGFYPLTGAKPGNETDRGVYGDDTYTPYSVGLQVSVNAAEFQTVINNLISQSTNLYQLENFNCSTAAVKTFASININLPQTNGVIPIGSVAAFYGLDPGDLGEDIRALDANTFSAQNGNRTVIIRKSNQNNQNPAPRTASCK